MCHARRGFVVGASCASSHLPYPYLRPEPEARGDACAGIKDAQKTKANRPRPSGEWEPTQNRTSEAKTKRESRSTRGGCGCPQWEVPRVGTPAPDVQRMGYTSTAWGTQVVQESSGAPTQEQPGEQPGEAMPSSREDARAAERARTGGANIAAPLTGLADLRGVCVCVPGIEVLLQPPGSNGLVLERSLASRQLFLIALVFIDKRTRTARGPYKPGACCISHKREEIGSAPEWRAFGFWVTRRLAV
jgi:hypothetical protein